MGKKTALYDQHVALNARIFDFAGFDLPLHYGSQLNEHLNVRQHAGVFDVSHMTIVDVEGDQAKAYLQYILANDVAKLHPHKALYSCMLNNSGGIIDDLIVYMLSENHYRLILNASTKEKDISWLSEHKEKEEKYKNLFIKTKEELSIIALQGPDAEKIITAVLGDKPNSDITQLKAFCFFYAESYDNNNNKILIARTGYTGEDGFEIIIENKNAVDLWNAFIKAGAHPTGLGARDTLRLEAGLNLYGQDMNESTSPYESNLSWTVSLEDKNRNFIGRDKLSQDLSKNISQKFMGIILEKNGVLRHDQKIFAANKEVGIVTSGGFSPVLNCSIGFARVENKNDANYCVQIRDKFLPIKITKPLFVRKGKPV